MARQVARRRRFDEVHRHAKAGSVAGTHVTRIRTTSIGGLALAGAVAVAVGGGLAIHAWARPGAMVAAPRLGHATTERGVETAAQAAGRLPDVAWLAERGDGRWLHGRGATTAPDVLPDGETGLAIDERHLASTLPASGGGSTIRLRDPDTGGLVGAVDVPIRVSAGTWTNAGLVVTGYPDATMRSDGGLILVTVPELSLRTLVEPRRFPAALGMPVARGDVAASPSGRVVASNVCGVRLCDTQVVDLSTSEVFRPIQSAEGFLRVVTDDLIVTTDDDYGWISARRFRDGSEAWRHERTMLLDPLAAADGSVAGVVGSATAGWAVASFDLRGRNRDLTQRTGADRAWPRIWRQVSTPTTAVVGREAFEDAVRTRLADAVTVVPVAPAAPADELPGPVPSWGTEVTP